MPVLKNKTNQKMYQNLHAAGIKHHTICIYVFLILPFFSNGQCSQQTVSVSNYSVGNCNSISFQSTLGQIVSAYGQCGNLRFDAPLLTSGLLSSVEHDIYFDKIEVFPNPAIDELQIKFPIEDDYILTLYDNLGRQIMNVPLKNSLRYNLSIMALHAGYYNMRIRNNENKIQIIKIIKI